MSNLVTKHPVTLSLSDDDFRDTIARGVEDHILYCPHTHHIEVKHVELQTSGVGWDIDAQIVPDTERNT